jgi:hypothetical protein
MNRIDSVASVPAVAATCGSGPIEEERLALLRKKASLDAPPKSRQSKATDEPVRGASQKPA